MENDRENNYQTLSDEQFFDSIPLGFRFLPTDDELINDYLKNKVNGEPLPRNTIQEAFIYLYHPEELCRNNMHQRENKWYFFSGRERKHPKGRKPNRQVKGKGFWKATGADKEVTHNDQIVGYKKSLDFYEGIPKNAKRSEWKMHEYRLDHKSPPPDANNSLANGNEFGRYVLCAIYLNTAAKNNNQIKKESNGSEDLTTDDEAMHSVNYDNIQEDPISNEFQQHENFLGFKNMQESGDQFLQHGAPYNYDVQNHGGSDVHSLQDFDELSVVVNQATNHQMMGC